MYEVIEECAGVCGRLFEKEKNCNGQALEEMQLKKKKWSGNTVGFVVQKSAGALL